MEVSIEVGTCVLLNPGHRRQQVSLTWVGGNHRSLHGEVVLASLKGRPGAGGLTSEAEAVEGAAWEAGPSTAGGERSGHSAPRGGGRLVPSCFHVLPLYLVPGSGLNHFHVFSQFPEENRTPREVNRPSLHSQTWRRWNWNPCLPAA